MRLSLPKVSHATGDRSAWTCRVPSHDRPNRRAYCLGVFDLEEGDLVDGDDAGPGFPEGTGFFGVELVESIQSAISAGSNFRPPFRRK
jgi:hypothetical protein